MGEIGAHRAVKIRTEPVGTALADRVAGRAFREDGLAAAGVGGLQEMGDRLLGLAAAVTFLNNAGDREASLLDPLGMKELVGGELRTEQHDARAQYPSRHRVEPTVHAA